MTKFLPENRRKAVIYILLLLFASAAVVYVNFFLNRSSAPPPSQNLTEFEGGLLPYGSQINPRILNDEKFKALKAFPAVTVDPSTLGKSNLFERQ